MQDFRDESESYLRPFNEQCPKMVRHFKDQRFKDF